MAQLKDLMLQLIDAGITPWCFYEGVWDRRLEYLLELPKGKTFGFFQSSDIFKVKEVLGDTMCIFGGMPISMLTGGNETQIREHTHELCERVGRGGGYIMTTGVLELEGCKPELVKAWVDASREYGEY
ncbi:MAG: uroporphyrinogen decarboxylase family protein [Acidobacteriota bacterium]